MLIHPYSDTFAVYTPSVKQKTQAAKGLSSIGIIAVVFISRVSETFSISSTRGYTSIVALYSKTRFSSFWNNTHCDCTAQFTNKIITPSCNSLILRASSKN
ncbi:hypothetical protein FGIG_01164 [Fasciola gigantica]|uniref:Uncharacterized protein n=1 Tax=Fasciola gigantica TaxID=46835 RepID=A0A504ZBP2_FASGI|nr:hypothetical protein FGIG_01164 [Fasciola gigantica]